MIKNHEDEGVNGTQRAAFLRSCITTILLLVTILLTIAAIALTVTNAYRIDYKYIALLWFVSLVVLYSIDQFILKKILWPIHKAKRKNKLIETYSKRISHQDEKSHI